MSLRKFTIGVAIVASGVAGGSVAASDYPPDVPPPSTVLTSTGGGGSSSTGDGVQSLRREGSLAQTGSDSGNLIKIAGGAVIAGAGLVVVTRRRRHPTPA